MSSISNLGYLVINVKDLDAWEDFAVNLIGFMVGDKSADTLSLRMDDYARRIILKKSDQDDIVSAGWQFDNEAELLDFVDGLNSKRADVFEANDSLLADRQVERLFVVNDPNGYQHELFYGPTHAPISKPFQSPVLRGPGFKTGRQGLGHLLTMSKNYRESIRFYTEVLGLRISDYIRDSTTLPGFDVDAVFFHTRTGRHHSLATLEGPTDQLLNHIMVEVQDLNDVGLAYDRCTRAGLDIIMGVGHHPNDHVVSFYVKSPSGFGVEFGHGSVIIDDDTWEVKNYSQMSDWGHQRNQPAGAN